MPISDRDYVRGEHPPTCTCKECAERRLAELRSQNKKNDKPRIKPRIGIPTVFRRSRFARRGLSKKVIVTLTGFLGTFILYVSLFPLISNAKDQSLFKSWWDMVWAVGGFLDYIRVAFVIITLLLVLRGLVGVILAPIKTSSANRYIFIGGIAGIALLIAFWSGILNGSAGMLLTWALLTGETPELNKAVVWGSSPPGLNFPIIWHMINWGWLKLSLIGYSVWVIGTAPFTTWWRRLT